MKLINITSKIVSNIIQKYKEINEDNIKRKNSPINIFSLSLICRAIRIFRQRSIKNINNSNASRFLLINYFK